MELIFSLDPNINNNVEQLLIDLKDKLKIIKIGHVLSSQGLEKYLKYLNNYTIFLDFKFLDIPNTVITSIKNYKKLIPTIKYYTIHGVAEENLIKACVDLNEPIPLSVIELSSNNDSNNNDKFLFQVERNIKLGIKHFVCPPNQVEKMKNNFKNEIKIFVPGIRNKEHNSNDHVSTIDFIKAKKLNIDFAIVGRPILESKNPIITINDFLNYQNY